MQCLKPNCTNEVDNIGVCVSCANSDYNAIEDGVILSGDTENPIDTQEPQDEFRCLNPFSPDSL